MYFSVLFRVQSRGFNELFPVSQNLVLLMTYLLFSLNEGRAEKRVLWNDASSPTREIWSSSQKQGWRQGLLSGRKGEIQKKLSKPLCKLSIARGLGLLRTLTSIERFHSRGQQNKRNVLRKKRVQLPQDWFGTPTWPLFHCFGTPIWPPWRHVETIYTKTMIAFKFSHLSSFLPLGTSQAVIEKREETPLSAG